MYLHVKVKLYTDISVGLHVLNTSHDSLRCYCLSDTNRVTDFTAPNELPNDNFKLLTIYYFYFIFLFFTHTNI